jgi:Raf kinase inhibitor-like YbhB/YbcL family protein
MHISRSDHFVLTVSDLEATSTWYARVLGMRTTTFGHGRNALAFGQQKINLHVAGQEFDPKAANPAPGTTDLCLISARPLDEVQTHLTAHGVAIEEGPVSRSGATGPITSVYVRDPDLNLIEISTYDAGRPQAPDPYDLLPSVPSFTLTSPDVGDATDLAMAHVHASAGGQDRSPALAWSGAPAGTRGYAITCFDPDAPTGSGFWHWIVVGLSAATNQLDSGAGSAECPQLPTGALHLRNDFGVNAYSGAAPPPGDPAHRYIFAVHAVDEQDLRLGPDATCGYAGFTIASRTIARAVLRPTFGR